MRISDWSSDVCSSDLRAAGGVAAERTQRHALRGGVGGAAVRAAELLDPRDVGEDVLEPAAGVAGQPIAIDRDRSVGGGAGRERQRSEEHTSELQSLMRITYAVFCLKKKKTKNN